MSKQKQSWAQCSRELMYAIPVAVGLAVVGVAAVGEVKIIENTRGLSSISEAFVDRLTDFIRTPKECRGWFGGATMECKSARPIPFFFPLLAGGMAAAGVLLIEDRQRRTANRPNGTPQNKADKSSTPEL